MKIKYFLSTVIAFILALSLTGGAWAKQITLLNVSYDPTRELYEDYNKAFTKYWKDKTGDDVTINQSQRRQRQTSPCCH